MNMADSMSIKFLEFSKTQIKTLHDAFQLLDEDGDGIISEQDLGMICDSQGTKLSKEELDQILQVNEGTTVTFPAFLSIMSNSLGSFPPEGTVRDALQLFSKDDDNNLECDADELRQYFEMLGYGTKTDFDTFLKDFLYQPISGMRVFKGKRFLETIGE